MEKRDKRYLEKQSATTTYRFYNTNSPTHLHTYSHQRKKASVSSAKRRLKHAFNNNNNSSSSSSSSNKQEKVHRQQQQQQHLLTNMASLDIQHVVHMESGEENENVVQAWTGAGMSDEKQSLQDLKDATLSPSTMAAMEHEDMEEQLEGIEEDLKKANLTDGDRKRSVELSPISRANNASVGRAVVIAACVKVVERALAPETVFLAQMKELEKSRSKKPVYSPMDVLRRSVCSLFSGKKETQKAAEKPKKEQANGEKAAEKPKKEQANGEAKKETEKAAANGEKPAKKGNVAKLMAMFGKK